MSEPRAVISECGSYRYALRRDVEPGPELVGRETAYSFHETALFVMLNPSTADAERDDATVRRCVGFARREGFGALAIANLYGLRSREPRALRDAEDPVGPENDEWIVRLAGESALVIAAWGQSAWARPRRVAEVCTLLREVKPPIVCLGRTKAGDPRHPLYVPRDRELEDFDVAAR